MNITEYMISSNYDFEQFLNEVKKIPEHNTFILQENNSLLWKYVKSLHNELNIEANYYEIWWKNKWNGLTMHFDCDEELKISQGVLKHPELSTVTYLSDTKSPTIITDINSETLLYQEFSEDNKLYLSFPQKNKVIAFDSTKYHSGYAENDNDRIIFMVNFWKEKPLDIENYTSDINNQILVEEKNIRYDISFNKIEKANEVYCEYIDYQTIKLLCNNQISEELKEHINKLENNKSIILSGNKLFKWREEEKNTIENNNIKNDFKSISENKIVSLNRFSQRNRIKNFLSNTQCNMIISDAENIASKIGWTTKRHNNYPTTDLPLDALSQHIKTIILTRIEDIIIEYKELYEITDDFKFNIQDIFVVKYLPQEKGQNLLGMHCDQTILSFQIGLNDNSEYEGGGTLYCDGLTVRLNKGELIIQSGYVNHSGKSITKGVRYLLVGFIELSI